MEFNDLKNDQVMTIKEVAKLLGITTMTLWRNRQRDDRIPFIKLNNGAVRYLQSDLREWMYLNKSSSHGQHRGEE
jgi:predicted DNA-binding transcriptional regulator AlpA